MKMGRDGISKSRSVRTGTVLVLVVGVLVMVMLIGVALLMTTRTETARVAVEQRAADVDALLEQAVAHVREVLRTDLWGTDDVLFSNDRVRRPGPDEQLGTIDDVLVTLDEPFDAFANLGLSPSGQEIVTTPDGRQVRATFVGDEWLGSTSPYFDPTVAGPPAGRLRWRRLSWVPLDEAVAINELFDAARDSGAMTAIEQFRGVRFGNPMQFVRFLVDNVGLPVRADGNADGDPAGASDPHFDMNRWFRVAYLDADGDGIRDSVRLRDQFAGAGGKRFDLAIRIVDHGSMLNLNAVFPWRHLRNWLHDSLPIRAALTRFDDPDAAEAMRTALSRLNQDAPLPLPGRNVTELLADQVVAPGEQGTLFQWAQAALTPPVSPDTHAAEFLRKRLVSGSAIVPYPSADLEGALRNRHSLLPYHSFNRADSNLPVSRLTSDLPQTMVFQAPQYWRYDENEVPRGNAYPLWMRRMSLVDGVPPSEFVRRPLLTTISKSQNRIQLPVSVASGAATAAGGTPPWFALPMIGADPVGRSTFHPVTGELIPPSQRWELIDLNTDPTARDLNRNGVTGYNRVDQQPLDPDDVFTYARHLASAMWLVLEGEPRFSIGNSPSGRKGREDELLAFQGDVLEGPIPPLGFIGDDTRRRRMAWQFAVNVIDYRDADLTPTVYGPALTGLDHPVYGVEPHPFITEVLVNINELADTDGNGVINGTEADQGSYAVELYNPYPFPLDIGTWRLGTKSGIVDIPSGTVIPAHNPRVQGQDSFVVLFKKPGAAGSSGGNVALDFNIAGELTGGPRVPPADRFVELLLPDRIGNIAIGDVVVDRVAPTDDQDEFAKQVPTLPGQVGAGGRILVRAMGRTVAQDARGRDLELDQWQFSVARQELLPETDQTFGERNTIDAGDDVAPSPWIFPWVDRDGNGTVDGHLGLPGLPELPGLQAFDNVFQLSNVFLVGPDPSRDPGDPRKTVTGFVAEAQAFLRTVVPGLAPEVRAAQTAAGRLNFFDVFVSTPDIASPDASDTRPPALNIINAHPVDTTLSAPPLELWTHRVLRYFSVGTAANDGINNDDDWFDGNNNGRRDPGEERLDEETEDHDITRSVVGRLNINTAPEEVLRAVSQLDVAPGGVAELAAAIVAYREDRPVNGFPAPRPLESYAQVPAVIRPYRSVAALSQIARNWRSLSQTFRGRPLDPQFRLDRHAVQAGEIGDLVFAPEVNYWNTGDGVPDDFRERQAILGRIANLLTVRSDVYTIYIALVDRNDPQDPDDDVYVRRVQLTVDRTNCYRSPDVLPEIIARQDSGYYDVKR